MHIYIYLYVLCIDFRCICIGIERPKYPQNENICWLNCQARQIWFGKVGSFRTTLRRNHPEQKNPTPNNSMYVSLVQNRFVATVIGKENKNTWQIKEFTFFFIYKIINIDSDCLYLVQRGGLNKRRRITFNLREFCKLDENRE